jgi:UDP-hydrolysing UDP-N-acetyl-D-glucosamine 2-epimerase
MQQKICIFTGTRAEYGLLKPIISLVSKHEQSTLQLVVAGSHLSVSGGKTENQIIADGFTDFEKVEILQDSASDAGVYTAMGLGLIRYGDLLARIKPDMVVILGDRFEAFAFATAATVQRIPIAHIHGGEVTVGAIDEAFRHSITKMSHLHFTSTEIYKNRVIQLGENPASVFNVGALGVENALSNIEHLTVDQVASKLQIQQNDPYFLITYHPVTLDLADPVEQFKKLTNVLLRAKDFTLIFTGANADQDGSRINAFILELVKQYPSRVKFFNSLGTNLYLNAAKYAKCVIGNSSSGIIEIPSLGVPVVNIGNRQKGRVQSQGILNCSDDEMEIEATLAQALTEEFSSVAKKAQNPYQRENTTNRIFLQMIESLQSKINLQKQFFDVSVEMPIQLIKQNMGDAT